MIKRTIAIFLFCIALRGEELHLQESHFIFEDDVDFKQDNDYTFGSEIGFLFTFPYIDSERQTHFLSFSYVWQMYNPKNFHDYELIEEDRPYAGYQYLKTALHRREESQLQTLSLQFGFIGPSTKMEQIQNGFHELIGAPLVNGWQHQLKDEMILQLNYSYRKYFEIDQKNAFLPDIGFELGNASTKVYAMILYRFGNDTKNDFGTTGIDNTSYYKIPRTIEKIKKWRYDFQLSCKTNFIARNIFLDGNTFKDSHKVEKRSFVIEIGYGLNLGYKNWSFGYLRKHLTQEFETQNRHPNYGSLIFGYQY